MQKELTPTEIATMSEVVAKYMGKIVYRFEGITWITDDDKCDVPIERWFDSHFTWDWIHSVWEKVKKEKYEDVNLNFRIYLKLGAVKWCLVNSTPLEAFTALFNFIEYINKLKQQQNEKI